MKLMRNALHAATLSVIFSGSVYAGIPTQREMICPVGGEAFTVTGTASCSFFDRVPLSLVQRTSCDFVDRLPQCPGNKLPMFRKFTPEEVIALESIVGSDAYTQVVEQHSRFYLAWWVAAKLGDDDPEEAFFHLLKGLWWDTQKVVADPVHLNEARKQLDLMMPEVSADNAALLHAFGGYLSMLLGDAADAKTRLDRAVSENEGGEEGSFTQTYIEALTACVAAGSASDPLCAPRLPR